MVLGCGGLYGDLLGMPGYVPNAIEHGDVYGRGDRKAEPFDEPFLVLGGIFNTGLYQVGLRFLHIRVEESILAEEKVVCRHDDLLQALEEKHNFGNGPLTEQNIVLNLFCGLLRQGFNVFRNPEDMLRDQDVLLQLMILLGRISNLDCKFDLGFADVSDLFAAFL